MVDWMELAGRHPSGLVEQLKLRIESGSSPVLDPAAYVKEAYTAGDVTSLFDALVQLGVVTHSVTLLCAACGKPQDADMQRTHVCGWCHVNSDETGDPPLIGSQYLVSTPTSRDVPWLIALHGFNTTGEWQEEFSWLVANKYRYHAPVLIFKFPLLRYGVMFQWRHRQIARDLGRRIRSAIEHAEASGIQEPPDIVAHSFGTLLFATLLQLPEFSDLQFGRVVFAGSVVRPDTVWTPFVDDKRIEAILNHCGQRDIAVASAQYLIPNSGPGGKVGISDDAILNVMDTEFDHGGFFTGSGFVKSMRSEGVWDRFLRLPRTSSPMVVEGIFHPEKPWRAANPLVRVAVRLFCIVVPLPFVALALWAVAQRFFELVRSLWWT